MGGTGWRDSDTEQGSGDEQDQNHTKLKPLYFATPTASLGALGLS